MLRVKVFTPKVSVIMPTYNRDKFIKEAVNSVINQNFRDWELIIVDDGSMDDTKKIINSIKDKRIIYRYHKNQGRSVARNTAIKIARGKYLAFLDSDDLFLPGKLKKQIQFLEKNPQYGMVYTSALNIDEKGKILNYIYKASKSGNIYQDVAFFLPVVITLPTVMVRKEIVTKLGGFDGKMERFEDTDMWRRIARETQIYALKDPLTKIRYHSGNQMEHPEKFLKALDYYIKKVFKEDEEFEWSKKRQAASLLYRNYAVAVKKHPEVPNMSYLFWWRSLIYWPLWPVNLFIYILYSYLFTFINIIYDNFYKLIKIIIPKDSVRRKIRLYLSQQIKNQK